MGTAASGMKAQQLNIDTIANSDFETIGQHRIDRKAPVIVGKRSDLRKWSGWLQHQLAIKRILRIHGLQLNPQKTIVYEKC